MKIVTKPSCYLVGRQQVQQGELDRFLADHEVSWRSDGNSAAEVVAETAGRLCFDEETEILTGSGWRKFSDVPPGCLVATMNPESRVFEFQPVKAVHAYDFDGYLLSYRGRDISFSVTPEHRQFAARSGKNGYREFKFESTEDLITSYSFQILTSAKGWVGVVPDLIYEPPVPYQQRTTSGGTSDRESKAFSVSGGENVITLAKLVSHYVANGSIQSQPGAGHGIVIYGREHDEIQSLTGKLGLPSSVWIDPRNGCPRTVIGGGLAVAKYFESNCGRGCVAKRFPDWILSLPTEILEEIWAILVKTDGHRYEGGREIFVTSSAVMSGQAQELLAKIGFSSSTSRMRGTNLLCYQVSKKMGRPAVVKSSRVIQQPYKGKVYCVTTDNGIVYVRRSGKVHFSGNCYLSYSKPRPGGNKAYLGHILETCHGSVAEHSVWNLVLVGISRSLSHELVRHRAGVGISQLSQRYVDESVAEYVVPPDLRLEVDAHLYMGAISGKGDDPPAMTEAEADARWPDVAALARDDIDAYYEATDAGRDWLAAVEHAHGKYKLLSDYLAKKAAKRGLEKTDGRKFARQAARSVLPNATETKVFLTLNARAARHVIEQRCSRFADPEIRILAYEIWKALRADSPNLFDDYTEVQLPDGTTELTTKWRKV